MRHRLKMLTGFKIWGREEPYDGEKHGPLLSFNTLWGRFLCHTMTPPPCPHPSDRYFYKTGIWTISFQTVNSNLVNSFITETKTYYLFPFQFVSYLQY